VDYHHFIITRFNVNIYDIDFPARLEETWLAERFDLFQRFCFPSIRAQHNQNFTWLVLFDEQTPMQYKAVINAYAKYENFVPLYCGAFKAINPTVAGKMQEMAPAAEWFLSTRVDNDDALAVGYTHVVQEVVNRMSEEQLKPSDTLYINFPKGLQWFEGDYYDFEDATNAFVSFIERRHDPHTVYWVEHCDIYKVAPVIQAETKPLWLQNVHDLNVYNYVRGEKLEQADFSKAFPHLG